MNQTRVHSWSYGASRWFYVRKCALMSILSKSSSKWGRIFSLYTLFEVNFSTSKSRKKFSSRHIMFWVFKTLLKLRGILRIFNCDHTTPRNHFMQGDASHCRFLSKSSSKWGRIFWLETLFEANSSTSKSHKILSSHHMNMFWIFEPCLSIRQIQRTFTHDPTTPKTKVMAYFAKSVQDWPVNWRLSAISNFLALYEICTGSIFNGGDNVFFFGAGSERSLPIRIHRQTFKKIPRAPWAVSA